VTLTRLTPSTYTLERGDVVDTLSWFAVEGTATVIP